MLTIFHAEYQCHRYFFVYVFYLKISFLNITSVFEHWDCKAVSGMLNNSSWLTNQDDWRLIFNLVVFELSCHSHSRRKRTWSAVRGHSYDPLAFTYIYTYVQCTHHCNHGKFSGSKEAIFKTRTALYHLSELCLNELFYLKCIFIIFSEHEREYYS